MPPVVIDLKKTDDLRDVVHRAVQALAEGHLVVFPTDTVYCVAASGLDSHAVARLFEWKGGDPRRPLAIALKSTEDAWDYVPDPPPLGERLARRCWPGPLTLVLDDAHRDSVIHAMAPVVRNAVAPEGTIGLRVPAHDVFQAVLRMFPGPAVFTSADRGEGSTAATAHAALEALHDEAALVLDDGPCKFGQPSSVALVRDHSIRLLRRGVLSESSLRQLASFMMIFVCTGNTCRSPMAELMMRNLLARKLNVPIEDLDRHGVLVLSAGVAAMAGSGPSAEAVEVMRQRGLDLSRHESQPLSERLVRFADVILTMTRGHRDAIVGRWPFAASRVHLLSRDGSDIADPIGGPLEMYQQCAAQIERQLEEWLDELHIDPLATLESAGD